MIELNNVSFHYEHTEGKSELQDISFSVHSGECLLLCGRSGSGKTTITKLINGLIPNFERGSLTGRVTVCGLDPQRVPQYELAKHIACVFQNPKSQFFNTDAESELVFNLENLSVPVGEIDKRLADAIRELNLEPLIQKSLFEMSGGEKQIIAFASAYVSGAEVIVLDEPSANLDLKAIKKIRYVIEKLKRDGRTIIISEHRLSYLRGIADKVCCLDQGHICAYMSADTFFALSEEKRIELGLRTLSNEQHLLVSDGEPSRKALLEVKELGIGYKKRHILENLSFSCSEGEIVGIFGKNGLGKTTLLRTLCGLQKQQHGSIFIEGKSVNRHQRQALCGLVMQDVNYQLFSNSVEEECRMGNSNVHEDELTRILQILSLDDFRKRHPQSLSGGQKQRLTVAVSYLCRKKILLLDEPTSGLDYENMLAVSKLLKYLAGQDILCIVVSHDVEFLNACCTRILELIDTTIF